MEWIAAILFVALLAAVMVGGSRLYRRRTERRVREWVHASARAFISDEPQPELRLSWGPRPRRPLLPRQRISVDDEGVGRRLRRGGEERVRWAELERVTVLTTSDGPWADDVFIVLEEAGAGCVVPSEAEQAREVIGRITRLPGFDGRRFLQALGSTTDGHFVCWERSDKPGLPGRVAT